MGTQKTEMKVVQTNRQQRIVPALVILVGIILLVLSIILESEPGAIPLLIILAGGLLFLRMQWRSKSQPK